jgi:hypothetical protein
MNQSPAIDYANGAGWVKWIGVLFTSRDMSQPPVSFVGTLVSFNTDQSGTVHDIVYDRVIIRPYEEERGTPPSATGQMSVGFGLRLDGANMSLINSTVDGFCCNETRQRPRRVRCRAVHRYRNCRRPGPVHDLQQLHRCLVREPLHRRGGRPQPPPRRSLA